MQNLWVTHNINHRSSGKWGLSHILSLLLLCENSFLYIIKYILTLDNLMFIKRLGG